MDAFKKGGIRNHLLKTIGILLFIATAIAAFIHTNKDSGIDHPRSGHVSPHIQENQEARK